MKQPSNQLVSFSEQIDEILNKSFVVDDKGHAIHYRVEARDNLLQLFASHMEEIARKVKRMKRKSELQGYGWSDLERDLGELALLIKGGK